jgi:hypothetical protein
MADRNNIAKLIEALREKGAKVAINDYDITVYYETRSMQIDDGVSANTEDTENFADFIILRLSKGRKYIG